MKKQIKKAIFVFGRFQPPQSGHKKIIDRAIKESKQFKSDVFVFTSQTEDKIKNPLSWEIKHKFLTKFFPNVIVSKNQQIKNPWDVLEYLNVQGYTDVIMVTGSDRFDEYNERLTKYAIEYFKSFRVICGGNRNIVSQNMSATIARKYAANNDFVGFKKITGWNTSDAKELMILVRKGMGL